jgi:hypothetical protein
MKEEEIESLIEKWKKRLTKAGMEDAIPEMESYVRENLYYLTKEEADNQLKIRYYMAIPEEERWIDENLEKMKYWKREAERLKRELKKAEKEKEKLKKEAEKAVLPKIKGEYEEKIKKLEEEIDKLKDERADLEEKIIESRKRIEELEKELARKEGIWVPPEKYWFVHVRADMPPLIWKSPLDDRYYGAYLECEWVIIPKPEYDPTVKNLIDFFEEIPRMSPGDVHDVWRVAEDILGKAGYRPSKYRLDIMSQIDWNETRDYNIALIRRVAEEFIRAMAIKAIPRVRAPEALPPGLRVMAEKFGLLEEKYVDIESMPEFEEFLSQIGISLRYYRIMDKLEREALRDAFRKWYAERYLKEKY